MTPFTIVNLLELDDAVAGRAEGVEGRFGRSHLGSEHLGVSHFRYAPSTRTPGGHHHREQEEVYVVVRGSGRILLDGAVRDLRQWDAVRLSPAVVRSFEAGPDGLEVLAIGADRPEGGDGVLDSEVSWPD